MDKKEKVGKVKIFCSNEKCKAEVTTGIATYSKNKYKKILCRICQEIEDKKTNKVEKEKKVVDEVKPEVVEEKVVQEEVKPDVETKVEEGADKTEETTETPIKEKEIVEIEKPALTIKDSGKPDEKAPESEKKGWFSKGKKEEFGYIYLVLKGYRGSTVNSDGTRYLIPNLVIEKTKKGKILCSRRCPVVENKEMGQRGDTAFIKVVFDETIMEWET